MKKYFLWVFVFSVFCLHLSAQPNIRFNKTTHDFGDVVDGTFPTTYFTFKNNGNEPLFLKHVTSSCGCTSPSYSKDSIMPGDSGFVKVVFNTRGYRNKDFAKSVIITSNVKNGTSDKVDILYITGHVIPKEAVIPQYPISLSGQFHKFDPIIQGKKAKWSFTISNNGDSTVVIKEFKLSQGYNFIFKMKESKILPKQSIIVDVTFNTKNLNEGEFYEEVKIITNLPEKNTSNISKQGIAFAGNIISKEKSKNQK